MYYVFGSYSHKNELRNSVLKSEFERINFYPPRKTALTGAHPRPGPPCWIEYCTVSLSGPTRTEAEKEAAMRSQFNQTVRFSTIRNFAKVCLLSPFRPTQW
ncbi:hypothetical protein PoB_002115400 [Plakobranchus ocellatus]|uniref:Uncharacterized protein n=1 Tax=Plakobranchus ocellatus TaxID=259542 RepID=A0AAV3ZH54_9GAST|nr:hypothetical protein PoB_002115400 [Plakobranchus ocellatus]